MSKPARSSSFARLLLFFSAITLFFLAITADQASRKLKIEQANLLQLQQISSLDSIIARTAVDSFVKNRISQVIDKLESPNFTHEQLSTEINKVQKDYETSFIVFYYENMELQSSTSTDPAELDLFSDLIRQLHLSDSDFLEAQRRVHEKLMSFFGPGNRLELLLRNGGKINRYKKLQKDNFYYWNDLSHNKSVFIIVTDIPLFLDRFAIARNELGRRDVGAGFSNKTKCLPPQGIDADQMLAARYKANLSGKPSVREFNLNWSFVEDESGQFYCLASEDIAKDSFQITLIDHFFKLAALFSLLAILVYLQGLFELNPGKAICTWLDSRSIRFRIVGIFAMASVFPVIFTALIGATSISERAEIIESQVKSESIANLNRLERMISTKIEQSEAMAVSMRNQIIHEPASEAFFQKFLQKYKIPRHLSRLEVRDSNGKELFTTDDRAVHGVVEAMDIFSRVALKQHAPHRLSQKGNMVTPAEIVSESVLSTDEIGMATVLRQRGRQWLFRMGTFPTLWYYDVFPEIATGPAFMHYTCQLIEVYSQQVEEVLAPENQKSDNLLLSTVLNVYFNDLKIYPDIRGLETDKLLDAAIVSMKTGKVLFRTAQVNNVPYWLTIKPEKSVNSHIFFNLVSKPGRLAALTPLKKQLLSSSILALMVSLVGAMLLVKLFIRPIGDLTQGINAIRERQNDFRIEVLRNDEFGALSCAFNRVIEELKELEYGRVVQESLLPSDIPVPEGFDLACFRTSATDLAGDYHDVLPLDDGRTAIILGDVTGHGISAALAMAMAKASVEYLNLEGKSFPSLLMDNLNALFNRELKPRHKFMTLVTIVLNPATGELIIDNAGQSYPYFFRKSHNAAEEIQIPSMPLGATKKRRSKPESRVMNKGDAVILYSDGIIECAAPDGKMFGYERFYKTFVELQKQDLSSQQILDEIMKQLDSFRKPGPYPDDVTLVLLKRI